MIKCLLFDLDDTLLINDMSVFAPQYFKALLAKVSAVCVPEAFMAAFKPATNAMWHNDGTHGTNAEVFYREFFGRLAVSSDVLMPLLNEFYGADFDALRPYTQVDPDARRAVQAALAQGLQVAVATQPIFPLTAIEARLRWAGVPADEFPYRWVTSYETMSACKPHANFFLPLVAQLGYAPEECCMVGDSLDADMGAAQYGLHTFWVNRRGEATPQTPVSDAQGTLGDLLQVIETGEIHEFHAR